MSGDPKAQLRRLLHLIPLVADGESHPIGEVAATVGVSRDTLLADLQTVSERFDTPAGFVDGVSIEVTDRAVTVLTSQLLRPMRLTMRELCALELGLGMLRRERTPQEQAPIDAALAVLQAAIAATPASPEAERQLVAAELDAAGREAYLEAIRGALRDRRKLRLRYRSGSSTETTERTICPYSLMFSSGMWYVVAICDGQDGLRIFRLDRIEGAERTDEPYEVPPGFSPDAVLDGGRVFWNPSPATLTVRYSPRIARWIAEREGAEPDADGSLTLEHPLADERWAVRHVLQYGPDAEVLAPASVRAAVRRALDHIAGA